MNCQGCKDRDAKIEGLETNLSGTKEILDRLLRLVGDATWLAHITGFGDEKESEKISVLVKRLFDENREMKETTIPRLRTGREKLREELRLERLKSKGLNDYAEFLEMPSLECYMRLDGLYHATLTGCEGTIDAVGEEYEDALRNLYKKLQKEAEASKAEDGEFDDDES